MFVEDKKQESIKQQIEREYREIEECKKGPKKDKKKNNKVKMVSVQYKPTNLNRIISSYKKQQGKDSEKFASFTPNESIIFTDTIFKWFNIQSRIINDKIPIVAKLVLSLGFYFRLLCVFKTWKLFFKELRKNNIL